MRTTELDPARTVSERLPAPSHKTGLSESPRPLPSAGELEPPLQARESRRWAFRPRRGWFRRLERNVGHWVSHTVFPRIPGIELPYSAQLRRGLTISSADLQLRQLPSEFDGMRLLLITDIHAGPFVSRMVLDQQFERLMGREPDLILLGGDLITSRTVEFDQQRHAFRRLRAPQGVYAVLGNHDHYSGESRRLSRMIEGQGIRLLHNRSVLLSRGGAKLSLAGVDDLLVGNPDLDAALAAAEPPIILLSHNPDVLFDAARRGVAAVLSGHTHAGQIRIPGLPVIVRQSRYRLDEGRYRTGETELIVSRGLGAVGIPLRLACPPEVVLLTLRRLEET